MNKKYTATIKFEAEEIISETDFKIYIANKLGALRIKKIEIKEDEFDYGKIMESGV